MAKALFEDCPRKSVNLRKSTTQLTEHRDGALFPRLGRQQEEAGAGAGKLRFIEVNRRGSRASAIRSHPRKSLLA